MDSIGGPLFLPKAAAGTCRFGGVPSILKEGGSWAVCSISMYLVAMLDFSGPVPQNTWGRSLAAELPSYDGFADPVF